jgi:tRNA pseudouridine13 synthase
MPADFVGSGGEGFEVLEAHAHRRKLPRGALAGNDFRIMLRGVTGEPAAIEARLERLRSHGVPNYFGPQRFGRELSNLAVLSGGSPPRDGRGFVLSAARSLIFNAVLAERVERGSWDRLLVGDRANLEGRNSNFLVEAVDIALEQRLAALDLHPTGPMWGTGDGGTRAAVAELEEMVAGRYPALQEMLRVEGMEPARRPLRAVVRDLAFAWMPSGVAPGSAPAQDCELRFSLRSGSFATVVLRELVSLTTAAPEDEHA